MKIIDCFPFYNELDLLEIRLEELDDFVDYFILAEATITHSGLKKPLYYQENKERYKKFSHKIIHLIATEDDFENFIPLYYEGYGESRDWHRERTQRILLSSGLDSLNLNCDDLVLSCDVDEIPKKKTLKENMDRFLIKCSLKMDLFYYRFNLKTNVLWIRATIAPYHYYMNGYNADSIRFAPGDVLDNAGWHMTYLGSGEQIQQKLTAYAHTEVNCYANADIDEAIKARKSFFETANTDFTIEDVDESYPKYIYQNKDRFIREGLIAV